MSRFTNWHICIVRYEIKYYCVEIWGAEQKISSQDSDLVQKTGFTVKIQHVSRDS